MRERKQGETLRCQKEMQEERSWRHRDRTQVLGLTLSPHSCTFLNMVPLHCFESCATTWFPPFPLTLLSSQLGSPHCLLPPRFLKLCTIWPSFPRLPPLVTAIYPFLAPRSLHLLHPNFLGSGHVCPIQSHCALHYILYTTRV